MQEVGVEEDVSEKREELIFEEEEEEVGVEEDVNEKCEEFIMEEEEVEVEVEVEDEEVIEKREAMKVAEDGMKEEVKDKNENDITEEDWQGLFRRIEDLAAECILDKSDHLNFCLMLISLSSFSKKSPTGPTERTPKSEYLNKSN